MTFAVVVVPLPLLPARGWRFVDVNDPGIRHVVNVMSSMIRAPRAASLRYRT
jgi:hypothetical protein